MTWTQWSASQAGEQEGKLMQHADNPIPPKAKKLSGRDGYRIRVGDYRIIYEIQKSVLVVLIIDIGHRREIYR